MQEIAHFHRSFCGEGASVSSFEHDAELETGHCNVPVERVEAAAAVLGISRNQLGACRQPACLHVSRCRSHRHAFLVGPRCKQPAEIEQWIAKRRHLPVDDGDELGAVARVHHVREMVIAVKDPGRTLRRTMPFEPRSDLIDAGYLRARITLVTGVRLELGQPARYLALEKTFGLAEIAETDRHRVETTKARERSRRLESHFVSDRCIGIVKRRKLGGGVEASTGSIR